MLHHIYAQGESSNGVSIYGHQIDDLLKGASLPKTDIWHFELSYTGTNELWAAEAFRRAHPDHPYVVTLHDPPVVCGKPFNRYISATNLGAKILRKALDLTVGRRLVRRVVRGARQVVVFNELAAPVVVREFGIEAARIRTLPLLPSITPPASLAAGSGELIPVLFFGILTPRKGVEDLLAAFATVYATNSRVRLTVFGGGRPDNPGYPQRLERMARDMGIDKVVVFAGYGDDAALAKAILSHSVVVLPYHDSDVIHASGPLVTSLAFGRAVIASDIATFRDKLADEALGRTFPVGNVAALAEQLKALTDDPAMIQQLGQAAYAHMQANHSPAIIKQQLLEVYSSL